MDAFPLEVEPMMRRLSLSLREQDRRRYAAIDAAKLGHGGIEHVARLLGCDPKTICAGIAELQATDALEPERARKKGGRKRLSACIPSLHENFRQVLLDHTAGDPMNADVKWTNVSRRQIACRLKELGTPVIRIQAAKPERKKKGGGLISLTLPGSASSCCGWSV